MSSKKVIYVTPRVEEILILSALGAAIGLALASPFAASANGHLTIAGGITAALGAGVGAFLALRQERDTHLKGARYYPDPVEALRVLQRQEHARFSPAQKAGQVHGISVGGLELSRKTETEHLFDVGITGSGKTAGLCAWIDQMIARGDRVVIHDIKGDLAARYFRPETCVMLGPWDARAAIWDAASDIDSPPRADEIAAAVCGVKSAQGPDAHWARSAANVLRGLIKSYMREGRVWTWADLRDALAGDPVALVQRAAAGEPLVRTQFPSAFGDGGGEDGEKGPYVSKEGASILSTLAAKAGWLLAYAAVDAKDKNRERFSIQRWLMGVEHTDTGAGAVAAGAGSGATGTDSAAFGPVAWASGEYSTAIGNNAQSIGFASTATGGGSAALALGTTATGAFAMAAGQYTSVLGYDAAADAANSTAIGAGAYADQTGTVSFGNDGSNGAVAFTSRLVNVAAGMQPFDAVNLQQLDAGGSAIAGWLGAGASFEAAGGGTFTAPTFVLTNPYTPGSYATVAGAVTALDTAIADVSKQPGPQGPAGPEGPAGPPGATGDTGPAGGTGTDPLAVHYDSTADATVTLQGISGTQVRNVAAGTAGTDAANVDQLQEALRSANTYTDIRSTAVLNQANAYTDMRIGQLNLRVNFALAAAASNANAAAAVAAQDPTHHNRVAVSDGLASGANAWTAMYQHKGDSGVTWNLSLTGEQGGGSSSERQVGVGIGYSW